MNVLMGEWIQKRDRHLANAEALRTQHHCEGTNSQGKTAESVELEEASAQLYSALIRDFGG